MKKNAFTLIELLAVIVILAIIALIATPIILGIINDSKEQTNKISAENYIDAVEQAIVRENMKGVFRPEECTIKDKVVTCTGYDKPLEVEVDGKVPTGGTIKINNGSVAIGTELIFKEFKATINEEGKLVTNPKEETKDDIVEEGTKLNKIYNNSDVVYFDVKEGKGCTNYHEDNSKTGYNGLTTTKTTDNQNSCLKFYAFLDDGEEKLNLLLDHNTTAVIAWTDYSIKTNANGPVNIIKQLYEDTKGWSGTIIPMDYTMDQRSQKSQAYYTIEYSETPLFEGATTPYKARLITVQEIAEITDAYKEDTLNWKEESSTEWFFFDSLSKTANDNCKSGNTTKCKYGWLYDRTGINCTTYGCLNNADVKIYGYSTSSTVANYSDSAWSVDYDARISLPSITSAYYSGVRPVITVLKSDLLRVME